MADKTVIVDGQTFVVRKAKVRDMMQHMALMSDNPQQFQIELAKASVYGADGELLGDALLDLGLKEYSELITPVMEVNGFLGNN